MVTEIENINNLINRTCEKHNQNVCFEVKAETREYIYLTSI